MKLITFLFFLSISSVTVGQYQYIDTTFAIDMLHYQVKIKALSKDCDQLTVIREGEVILKDSLAHFGLNNIQFVDFNKDENCDIQLIYYATYPYQELYLFDNKSKSYKAVDQFMFFPDATKLKADPELYFSYTATGCGDLNWQSHLFKIVDFKVLPLAVIYGNGCDFILEGEPQNIDVYKNKNGDMEMKELELSLPYTICIPQPSDKWSFIDKYWNEKYLNFK